MAYAFALSDKTVPEALRRIASEELSEALARLSQAESQPAETVHALRKGVKRLRGLIRLVRPNFPGWAAENAALRDAARAISGLRDADVLGATLERLAAKGKGDGAEDLAQADLAARAQAFDHLRAEIAAHRARTRAASGQAALDHFRGEMTAALARVPDWQLRGKSFKALEEGLAKTWDQARKQQNAARRAPGSEAIHDWRKRVKDHAMQTRLLLPIWPLAMEPHAAAAERLGEMLGLHHDLAVLRDHLGETGLGGDDRAMIAGLADQRMARIETRAQALGTRLFAGGSEALLDRWGAWWKVWHEGR